MMNRKQTIESLRNVLVDRIKSGKMNNLSTLLSFSTGYMPDLTLNELDVIIKYMRDKHDIIF